MSVFAAAHRLSVRVVAAALLASVVAILCMFPYSVDPPAAERSDAKQREYYAKVYTTAGSLQSGPSESLPPLSEKEQFYIDVARKTAARANVPETVRGFVEQFGLTDKKVLEVGAGSGLLQDIVPDYTALDISASARRFFHKPFVEASATEMPFPDNSFDALWSVWVLEHIPTPEKALLEMRRVVKPGGHLFLNAGVRGQPVRRPGVSRAAL